MRSVTSFRSATASGRWSRWRLSACGTAGRGCRRSCSNGSPAVRPSPRRGRQIETRSLPKITAEAESIKKQAIIDGHGEVRQAAASAAAEARHADAIQAPEAAKAAERLRRMRGGQDGDGI
jgi:hypothetical protein